MHEASQSVVSIVLYDDGTGNVEIDVASKDIDRMIDALIAEADALREIDESQSPALMV